jgi:hypothetical protein
VNDAESKRGAPTTPARGVVSVRTKIILAVVLATFASRQPALGLLLAFVSAAVVYFGTLGRLEANRAPHEWHVRVSARMPRAMPNVALWCVAACFVGSLVGKKKAPAPPHEPAASSSSFRSVEDPSLRDPTGAALEAEQASEAEVSQRAEPGSEPLGAAAAGLAAAPGLQDALDGSPKAEARRADELEGAVGSTRDLPFRLVERKDRDNAIKDSRVRTLLILGELDDEALRAALLKYYAIVRNELRSSRNETRHIFLFAFPTEARARGGIDWRASIGEVAQNGEPLPVDPHVEIRVQAPELTTPREEAIYDEMMDALEAAALEFDHDRMVELAGRDPPTNQDMQRIYLLMDEKEERVKKAIAKKHALTTEQLRELSIRVAASRN